MGDVPRQQCTHARTHTHTDTRTRPYTHERAQSMYVDIKPVMRELFDNNPVVNSVDRVVLLAPGEMPVESLGMAYRDTNNNPDNGIVTGDAFARWYLRRLAQIRNDDVFFSFSAGWLLVQPTACDQRGD